MFRESAARYLETRMKLKWLNKDSMIALILGAMPSACGARPLVFADVIRLSYVPSLLVDTSIQCSNEYGCCRVV
jgi:hypothetical protein